MGRCVSAPMQEGRVHWFALARCVEAVRSSCSLFGVDGGAAGGCDKPAEHRGAKHANQAPWRRAHLLSQAGQGLAGAQGSHAAAAAGGWQCGGNLGEGRGETEGRGVPLQHSMLASGVVPRSAARGRGGGASSTRQPTGFSVGWGLGGGIHVLFCCTFFSTWPQRLRVKGDWRNAAASQRADAGLAV